uniref:Uncharacterized protein LOC102803574 n=1 Tax=Saccoglossus kowalevskii TaxID=10224 RepID=A0ABM0MBW3_SACKO|nr:PREDICTED: uncharacterized protein LOC102803574 [Saccoglossus kowalevskii]
MAKNLRKAMNMLLEEKKHSLDRPFSENSESKFRAEIFYKSTPLWDRVTVNGESIQHCRNLSRVIGFLQIPYPVLRKREAKAYPVLKKREAKAYPVLRKREAKAYPVLRKREAKAYPVLRKRKAKAYPVLRKRETKAYPVLRKREAKAYPVLRKREAKAYPVLRKREAKAYPVLRKREIIVDEFSQAVGNETIMVSQ